MRVSENNLFTDRTLANETINSDAIPLDHIYGFSVYASWSGTAISGSILLQASIDEMNWRDIDSTSQTISADGSYLWNISDAFYKYFRIQVTSSNANTITVDASFYAKGV